MPDRKTRGNWPEAPIIYEIYPRSFRDTTGSGEGDLRGILEGLDHIASLGIDAIWIAPFFESPMRDGGYDIVDHCAVDPRFGTLDDFDRIVSRAHELGLLVMIDQVLNHSSDQHLNFQNAINGDEDCAAAYVWRDPKPDGTAPNNWLSYIGPPAWTWNHKRRQYYLHQYLAAQPSFNMRCEKVQAKHRDEMRFWLARGVDGFRLDAVTAYLFDDRMADNPPADPETRGRVAVSNDNPYSMQNHVFDLLPGDGASYAKKLRDWSGPDIYLLGEINTGNRSVEVAQDFVCGEGLDAAYVMDVLQNGGTLNAVTDVLKRDDCKGSLAWWMGSHDQPRAAETPQIGQFYLLLHAMLPGPVMIFQGEELGLPSPDLKYDEIIDPFDKMYWPDGPGREYARVPLPWTEEASSNGFTTGTPWLPMRWPEGASVESGGLGGTLEFLRTVIAFRKSEGLGTHQVTEIEIDREKLEIRIDCGTSNFRGLFNLSGEWMECPDGVPLIANCDVGEDGVPPNGAAVWRL